MVEAKIVGDDIRHWKGKIFGPVSINSKWYKSSKNIWVKNQKHSLTQITKRIVGSMSYFFVVSVEIAIFTTVDVLMYFVVLTKFLVD